jgi:hypothetical protein
MVSDSTSEQRFSSSNPLIFGWFERSPVLRKMFCKFFYPYLGICRIISKTSGAPENKRLQLVSYF